MGHAILQPLRDQIDSSRDSGWDAVAESRKSLAEVNVLLWKTKLAILETRETLARIRRERSDDSRKSNAGG